MDPDSNYKEQQELYHAIKNGTADAHDRARLRELVAALRGWISAGGFRPKGYAGVRWTPAAARRAAGSDFGKVMNAANRAATKRRKRD